MFYCTNDYYGGGVIMRLTKYEPNDESMFPYKLKDEELSTELDSIHKLGQVEDILEKHSVPSLDDLENILAALDVIKEHKLLNYVLKNEKCANMYHLSKEKCDLLKEALK